MNTVAVSESRNIAIGCLTSDAYTYIHPRIHSHPGAVTESGDIATGYLTSDAYNVIHIHCHTQTQASQIEEWRGAVALCDTTS